MTPEPVEALVERVRRGMYARVDVSVPDARVALTELAERVKAAERERDAMEACDCLPMPYSSAACGKCGRRGVAYAGIKHPLETQRDELVEALERFMEWDALTALPDPLPAPFGDLPYWLTVFRVALAKVRGEAE